MRQGRSTARLITGDDTARPRARNRVRRPVVLANFIIQSVSSLGQSDRKDKSRAKRKLNVPFAYLWRRGDRRFNRYSIRGCKDSRSLFSSSLLGDPWLDPFAGSPKLENGHVLADPPARGGMNVGARQDE